MGIIDDIRAHNQEVINEEKSKTVNGCIEKAAMAMLEAGVEKQIISQLLGKYWELSPSEAEYFVEQAEIFIKKDNAAR